MNVNKCTLSNIVGVSISLLVSSALSPAWAQDAGSAGGASVQGGGLDDIVVTAQRRAENLQDVGLSVLALTSKDIDQRGMTDMTSIVQQTPGLGMIQFSPAVTIFSLRGVSQASYLDNLEGPVAVYLDDSYLSANGSVSGSMFDMERIEVLRGPQGTLFGRNATGGLIHFITKKPSATREGYLRVTGAEYGEFNAEGAVGGPISGDLLGRISFAYKSSNGYIKDTNGPTAPEQNNYALRGQLSKHFGEDTDVLLSLRYSRNPHEVADGYMALAAVPNADGLGVLVGSNENPWDTCDGCNLLGYQYPDLKTRTRTTTGTGDFDRTIRGAALTVTSAFGDVDFTSVTDYSKMNKRWQERTDPSPVPVLDSYITTQKFEQITQELRLNGDAGKLKWVGGFYFMDMKTNNGQRSTGVLFGLDYLNSYVQKTRSESIFGQVDYAFNDQWSATLGGRYSFDQKSIDFVFRDLIADKTIGLYNPNTDRSADRNFNGFSGRAALNFKPSEDVLLYASVNRGYKGGNWSLPIFPPFVPTTMPHNSEKLTSYELGAKSTLADGRIRLNGNLFYYDYADYQAFTLYQGIGRIVNRDAIVKGAEIEFAAAPVQGLTLELSYSYLYTKVKGITLPNGRDVDSKMPMSPKSSLNGMARYQWDALGGTLAVQADGKYETEQYFTTFNAPVDRVPARLIANARVSYTRDLGASSVEIAGFVRNLTNKLYPLYNADVSSLGFTQLTIAPPRVFGGEVTFRF